MSEKLTKIVFERASKSKDPERYLEIVKELYSLEDESASDDEFIKKLGW